MLRPTNCLAISAKRYVLFDRDPNGVPIIRKAMRHGLGHLIEPYPDPDRSKRMEDIGAELWQEDLWKAIIAADDDGHPTVVDYASLRNFDGPAASRYAATNPVLLDWFKDYNAGVPEADRVQPFNFLLSYQAKSAMEMSAVDPHALNQPIWRKRVPAPASRYSSDLIKDQPEVFDRRNRQPFKWEWLETRARSLVRYHLHSEIKFRGGEDDQTGMLERRLVEVWAVISIGKEADNLELREAFGEHEDAVEWDPSKSEQAKIAHDIEALISEYGIKAAEVIRSAGVSHHTLADLRRGRRVSLSSLYSIAMAVEMLRKTNFNETVDQADWRDVARKLAADLGSQDALANALEVSGPYLSRVLNGRKPVSSALVHKMGFVRVHAVSRYN